MDTRSTKFKYSLFTKVLCLLLSALMFFSFAYSSVVIITSAQIYGFEEYFTDNIPAFYDTYGFRSQFSSDNFRAMQLINQNKQEIEEAFDLNEKAIIERAVNDYLNKKAEIIRNELEYAVENYDESYFAYEYTADTVTIPAAEETSSSVTVTTTDEIPQNIAAAIKILENCSGLDFLKYSTLIRSDALTEKEYQYSDEVYLSEESGERYIRISFWNNSGYNLNESEIKKLCIEQYNSAKSNETATAEAESEFALALLSKLTAFKYYISDHKGNIYTNIKNTTPDEFRNKALENKVYVLFNNTLLMSGLNEDSEDFFKNSLEDKSGYIYYVYIDNEEINLYSKDTYGNLRYAYDNYLNGTAKTRIVSAFIYLIISIMLLIILMCLCGHKNDETKPSTALTDKIPTDIHFILSAGITVGIAIAGLWLGNEMYDTTSVMSLVYMYAPILLALIFTVSFLTLTEWLTSAARIRKSGEKFFSNMLIYRLVRFIARCIRKLTHTIKQLCLRPEKLERRIVNYLILYIVGNLLLMITSFTLGIFVHSAVSLIAYIVLAAIYNTVVLSIAVNYIRNLDKIITASSRHESVNFGNEKVPDSLKLLASNLTNTNEALREAVDKAVRDEQLKTELITNVSHDLKTPLTSLISYSDLLDKCDIDDETAKKYIDVIHTQSIKLKRLIEDLIEASKVSTGNVTLNRATLNLSELAIQAIAEFAPEMEKNGNEIIFTEPDTAPAIFADGSKTYRILANLLNNAKKYSAPDTRIYITVSTDGKSSYFEIKNISAEPLNIAPEELTERFVRGDKSRSREGNGLGLSIAKDLCTLQNGELKITIDGDLFKATVRLPAN